jgi:hypothetical protein
VDDKATALAISPPRPNKRVAFSVNVDGIATRLRVARRRCSAVLILAALPVALLLRSLDRRRNQ